jgi:hypothetical protein
MPSRTERVRRVSEWAARAAVVVLAGWLASLAWTGRVSDRVERAESTELARALTRWSSDPAVAAVHVEVKRPPGPSARAWLRALAAAGVNISWSGDPAPLAVAAMPVRDPFGGSTLAMVGLGETRVGVADAAGPVDSLAGTGGAATLSLRAPVPPLIVTDGEVAATTRPHATSIIRPVLVLGRASWETKFVIAALEERGWRVVSRTVVAPGVETSVESVLPIDTSRFSAVVVTDSTGAAFARAIAAYVRTGGGLVVAGDAASIQGLAAISPGRPGRRVAPPMVFEASEARLELLGFHPVTGPGRDALSLREDRGRTAVAVRREELGRVVQVGYDESWRLRMSGGDEGTARHGDWWNRLVSTVAYAPEVLSAAAPSEADPAPRAALFHALGEPAQASVAAPQSPRDWRRPELLVLLILILLLEVGSRRARGET